MLYEHWRGSNCDIFLPAGVKKPNTPESILEPDAVLINTIEADNWVEAMTKYHEYMGWEPYVPMDDELGL